jgi:hypothetical protein
LAVAGAAGVAGIVAANMIVYRKMMAMIGGKNVVTKATTTLTSRITTGFKNMGTKIVQILKHPKVVISQLTSNIGNKLKNISTSMRTAITGMRTALTTSTSRITSFFTKGLNAATSSLGTRLGQIVPKMTTALKNVTTAIGSKVGQILPKITKGFTSLAGSIGTLTKGLGTAMGGIGKTLGNLFTGKNIGKMGGKGGIIGLIAMLTEGTAASPETLGGLIDQNDPNRLDKQFPWLFGNKLSEDEEGNFQTSSQYGQWLADVTNNPDMQEGIVNQMWSGEATGTGGGARGNMNERGNTIIINVDHISNEMDLKHVGDLFSEKLQEDNKKTAET